jgi:hypothetical protein
MWPERAREQRGVFALRVAEMLRLHDDD